jgi:mono/diheme cytochrome c family protein
VDFRSTLKKNGRVFAVAAVVFGLPLPGLAIVSGLHWGVAAALFVLVLVAALLILRVGYRKRELDWAGRLPRVPVVVSAALAFVLVALVIQLVPYGRGRVDAAVAAEPAWDSERTRELTVKACFDCHSNEIDYPWYSNVAPISWAVQRHVDAGRHDVNFSEWNRRQKEAHESAETVEEASMPPWYYTVLRPGLLTEAEKQDLIRGLKATLGTEESDDDRDEDEEADDD